MIMSIRMCEWYTWWYQLEVDPYFISGKKANANAGEVKSLRERLHITYKKGINNIATGALKAKADDIKEFYKNGHLLLKSDSWWYPVKLLIHPEQKRPVDTSYQNSSFPCNPLELPDLDHAYRVDAAYFYPAQSQDFMEGYRDFPESIEPVSGCYGLYPTPGSNLPVAIKGGKRKLQVRVLTASPLTKTTMQCSLPRIYCQSASSRATMNRTICEEIRVVDDTYKHSGFAMSQLMHTDWVDLDFSGCDLNIEKFYEERVLFVEFIVHDKSDQKPLTNITPLP
ncbi:hypothetical protein DFA_02931 [Cavenderia fasciculata]|uniref:Uncharacterized protein n=1 Tax=Cavenderia fasciculata TaxID=261658 RepID=F4PG53_CACFS|nr:uncharacterized protein DFA_02931 [Cavenderia fasciculata]EGG24687.1 hypothetical protein DFA_02931 [Cavenderia fasciculata]|eukprot:XP_004362538.1 hypothetical protein DFA_02931 [Cavenderia fasciculata]